MNFQATFLLQLSLPWDLISTQLCLYNAFTCNTFRNQLSYFFIISLVLTWSSRRCEIFRKPLLATHFGKRLFFKRVKKFYKIDGVPRNLVGMLLEERGTKLCQRFFPFLLLCFCSFMFVMFSVLDRLFIKCKYFPISSSGGAQVYVKKNYWITRQCWQLFEDWLFVTETVRLLFTRGHVWYPIQSTEKCLFIFSFTIFLVSFRSGEEQQNGL